MNRFSRSAAVFLFFCSLAKGSILSLGGISVFLSDEITPVPIGSFISVGYFDPTFTSFSLLPEMSWDDITVSIYTEVGSGIVNPEPGEWAGGGNAVGIEGQHLHVWVFESIAAPVNIGDTEFGLFTGSSPEWTARGDGEITSPQFNFLGIDSVDTAIHGKDMGANLALAPIPEPAHVAGIIGLIVLGAVALKRVKRRS